MDERTQKNRDRLAKQYPNAPAERVAEIAASIAAGADTPNDPATYAAAVKAASRAATEAKHPTPSLPPLDAVSDSQRDFAVKVRAKHIADIRDQLDALEQSAAEVRAGGGDPARFEQKQAELAKWLGRLAAVKSAKRILDTKDNSLRNVSPVVADVIAKKLGVQL